MAQAWKTSLRLITQSNFFPPQHHLRLRQVVDTIVQVRLEVHCRLPPLPPLPALTHKERNQSHEVDWSLLMREDAKSKKKLLANKPSSHFKDSQFIAGAQHAAHNSDYPAATAEQEDCILSKRSSKLFLIWYTLGRLQN